MKSLSYGSTPALADGVLVVFLNGLFGLDAKTGKLLWQKDRIRNNVGSLLGTTIAGRPVVVAQRRFHPTVRRRDPVSATGQQRSGRHRLGRR